MALVTSRMDDEYSVCTALLHDVIEDAGITPEKLNAEGFPDEVILAVVCLTHDKDIPYMDYIRLISTNLLAVKVKLSDLAHNSDLSRIPGPSPNDYARLEKYQATTEMIMRLSTISL